MKELHILFCGTKITDPAYIQKTLFSFPAGITLLVCSQSPYISEDLRSRIGIVYSFMDPFLIHPSTIKEDSSKLSTMVREFISEGYEVKFNISTSGPFECYVAFTISQHYPPIEIYSTDEVDKVRHLNLDRGTSLNQLREDEQLLLLYIGESQSGRTYSSLCSNNIITRKEILKKRGIDRLLKTMCDKYIFHEQMKTGKVAGKPPYIWKLNDTGQRLFDENYDSLKYLELESRQEFNKRSSTPSE